MVFPGVRVGMNGENLFGKVEEVVEVEKILYVP